MGGRGGSTLRAGLAPCSSKHLAAPRHRFEAAMCRAEPWLKSLHVEFTTGKQAGVSGAALAWSPTPSSGLPVSGPHTSCPTPPFQPNVVRCKLTPPPPPLPAPPS